MDTLKLQNLQDVFLVTEYSAAGNILAVVSLIISAIAFGASIFFFYHSQRLNQSSENALNKLNERIGAIQGSVDGMFHKTLDAALSKEKIVSDSMGVTAENLGQIKEALQAALNSENKGGASQSAALEQLQSKIEAMERNLKGAQSQINRLNQATELEEVNFLSISKEFNTPSEPKAFDALILQEVRNYGAIGKVDLKRLLERKLGKNIAQDFFEYQIDKLESLAFIDRSKDKNGAEQLHIRNRS